MAQRQWVKRPVMERCWIFLRDSNSGESALASAMGITLRGAGRGRGAAAVSSGSGFRSEEHTSGLQSPCNFVCRLLLEKKKTDTHNLPLIDTHVLGHLGPPLHAGVYRHAALTHQTLCPGPHPLAAARLRLAADRTLLSP